MNLLAVTVIGHDRPGIIAEVTGILAGLGVNLEDSSMTLLRGHFAWMLVCSPGPGAAQVEHALRGLTADSRLVVTVRSVPAEDEHASMGRPFVVTVHGADRPGIVSAVTKALAAQGGNVTDLSTRLAGGLYVLVAEVDLPADVDDEALAARLRDVGQELGVDVAMHSADTDVL